MPAVRPRPALLAAQLAAARLRSSLDVLDGDGGLGRAMSTGPDWSQVGATLGRRLPHHSADLQEPHRLRPHLPGYRRRARTAAPARIHARRISSGSIVATYKPALDIARHVDPRNCRRSPVQPALHRRHGAGARQRPPVPPTIAGRLDDAATRALMKRITAAVDPEIDAGFPGRRAARVEVTVARRPQLHPLPARPQGRPRTAIVRRRTRRQADRTRRPR